MFPAVLSRLLTRHREGRRFDLKLQTEAYKLIPQMALADLAEFCFALEPLPRDRDAMLRAEGRREVWLRIVGHRTIREDEIIALLRGEVIAQPPKERPGGRVV